MVERIGSHARVLSAVLPLGAAAAAFVLVQETGTGAWPLAVAAVLAAAAGLVRVPGASGTDPTPALAVAASLPLIEVGDRGVFDPAGQAAVVAMGLGMLWILRTARGDDPAEVGLSFVRRLVSAATYLVVYAFLQDWIPQDALGEWRIFGLFAAASLAAFSVEVGSAVVFRSGKIATTRRYRVLLAARELDAFTIIMATGGLFGLTFDTISWWAAAVAVLPYAFAHGAFHRFEKAKETYSQMLRALARIPEVGGHNALGHAERTAVLAVAVATDMGLGPSAVEEVEHTALMHDIGRVALNEPGVAHSDPGETELGRWGAEIVGEADILSGIADAVRRRHEPYRNPGEDEDPDVPLAARIVKAASAYDDVVVREGLTPLSAVERLHEGTVYEYDPAVVRSIRRVLERGGGDLETVDLRPFSPGPPSPSGA